MEKYFDSIIKKMTYDYSTQKKITNTDIEKAKDKIKINKKTKEMIECSCLFCNEKFYIQ